MEALLIQYAVAFVDLTTVIAVVCAWKRFTLPITASLFIGWMLFSELMMHEMQALRTADDSLSKIFIHFTIFVLVYLFVSLLRKQRKGV